MHKARFPNRRKVGFSHRGGAVPGRQPTKVRAASSEAQRFPEASVPEETPTHPGTGDTRNPASPEEPSRIGESRQRLKSLRRRPGPPEPRPEPAPPETEKLSGDCGEFFVVELPGFEPGITGPESVVLPLHHSSMRFGDAKVELYFSIAKNFPEKIRTFVLTAFGRPTKTTSNTNKINRLWVSNSALS